MAMRETSLTLTEAAQATGKSRVTMRRYLDADRFPHAFRDESSGEVPPPWRVPVTDLVAAGLAVRASDRVVPRSRKVHPDTGGDAQSGSAVEVQQLREALAVATALADERARTIDVLTVQLADLRVMLADSLATTRAAVTGTA